ncbi:MAG: HAAS signaling domain-containing protein, partial [Phycisphaerales bacterium]
MNSAEPSGSPDPVRVYLALLEAALEHQDAALRHDALLDAEAHLRSAIATGLTAEQAIADFGTPAEIAGAYSGSPVAAGVVGHAEGAPHADRAQAPSADVTVPARGGRLSRIPVVGVWFQPRAWTALLYFGLIGFPLAAAYFVWAVTIGSLAIGTLPLILGLPLVVFLLGSARALSLFEGKVVETFLGVRM